MAIALGAFFAGAAPALGQGPVEVTLSAASHEFGTIEPGQEEATRVIVLDEAVAVRIVVVCPIRLGLEITRPDGSRVTAAVAAEQGVRLGGFTLSSLSGALPLPGVAVGEHTVAVLSSPPPGRYALHLRAPVPVSERTPFVVGVYPDSPVAMAVSLPEPESPIGVPIVLTAVVLEGVTPLPGTTVVATLYRDLSHVEERADSVATVTLLDDGAGPDPVGGDGVLTGILTDPLPPGLYTVFARAQGRTSGGSEFQREAGADVRVIESSATIETVDGFDGIDDDGNGLFDRLRIRVNVRAAGPGEFSLSVQLRAGNGRTASTNALRPLAAGTHGVDVDFPADYVLDLKADAPYTIELLRLDEITTTERLLRDRRTIAGIITGFRRSQFDRGPIETPLPAADAGGDQSLECTGVLTDVHLDGSASQHPLGLPLAFTWTGSFGSAAGVAPTVTLPVGDHAVSLTLEDEEGGVGFDDVTIKVADTTPPALNVPPAVALEASAVLTPLAIDPAASDRCGPVAVGIAPAMTAFPVGVTHIVVTAIDQKGNSSRAPISVTVSDTTPPAIVAPRDVIAEANALWSSVAIGTASATDIFDLTVSNDAPVRFPLGPTSVTWTATDVHGNRGAAAQIVTVVDTTPPRLTPPADVTAEASGPLTPVVIGTAVVQDIFPVTVSNDAPAAFPLGSTTVRWTAADSSGNVATADHTVTVVDTTPPAIRAPADLTIVATGPLTMVELGTATATDIFGVAVTNDAPPRFPVGTTRVHWKAVDVSGNHALVVQTVRVVYVFGGFSSPVATNGSYKAGRTLPVKFSLSYAGGAAVVDAAAKLRAHVRGPSGSLVEQRVVANGSQSGDQFRRTGGHYQLNLDTGSWAVGSYRLSVELSDDQAYSTDLSLR